MKPEEMFEHNLLCSMFVSTKIKNHGYPLAVCISNGLLYASSQILDYEPDKVLKSSMDLYNPVCLYNKADPSMLDEIIDDTTHIRVYTSGTDYKTMQEGTEDGIQIYMFEGDAIFEYLKI